MDFSLQLLPEQPLAELIDVIHLADRRFGPEVSGIILRDPTLIAQQAATPETGDRLSIAGDPAELAERLRSEIVPHGYHHVALGLVDLGLIESWSGRRIDGLPSRAGQLELFAARVVPALAGA